MRTPKPAHVLQIDSRAFAVLCAFVALAIAGSVGHFVLAPADAADRTPTTHTLWPNSATPRVPADPETDSVELGVKFRTSTPGWVTAIRYFKSTANTGRHTGTLWSPAGAPLARVTFANETASGWQEAALSSPVLLTAGKTYIASYRAPQGRYADDTNGLSSSSPRVSGPLTATAGVYTYGKRAPSSTWKKSNYYVDVRFRPGKAGNPSAPTTNSTSTSTSTSTSSSSSTTRSPSSTTHSSTTSSSTSTKPTTSSTTSATTSTSSSTSTRPTTSSTTSTTSRPSPTSTASVNGCAAKPSACGYPDATNTGVQAGATLKPSGCITARTPGQVIENVVIDGCTISVEAPNVTIRNVKLTHTSIDMWAIIIRSGSATISNVEIAGRDKGTRSVQYAILSQTDSTVTVDRANLHHCADCIQGERMVVTNSYIHDLANPPEAHVDGFQCNAQCEVTLRHNTILNEWSQTSAIALFADFGTPRNSVIDNNLLAGGGYSLYAGTDRGTGIKVTNNRFARTYYGKGGYWGPACDYANNGTGNTWTGNIWDDTGATVAAA